MGGGGGGIGDSLTAGLTVEEDRGGGIGDSRWADES